MYNICSYPSEGCFSDVMVPLRTPNPQQSQKSQKMVRTKIVHTSGTLLEKSQKTQQTN